GAGRSAVSGLMPRRPRTISFTRAGVTPMARASALLESPSGCMKSACRISPGWTGGSVSMETSVIVHDLDIRRTLFGPGETQPELIVDADAVLVLAIAPKRLQAIAGRNRQVVQVHGRIEIRQLAARNGLNVPEAHHTPAREQRLRILAAEAPDRYID